MNIYITRNSTEASNGLPELLLIEFQGEIECPNDDFQSQLLAHLEVIHNPVAGIKYGIDIGIHHLEGKSLFEERENINLVFKGELKKMDKMLLVTKNNVISPDEARLEAVGICKEKIVFNKRPTPVLRQELKKVKITTEITDVKA